MYNLNLILLVILKQFILILSLAENKMTFVIFEARKRLSFIIPKTSGESGQPFGQNGHANVLRTKNK